MCRNIDGNLLVLALKVEKVDGFLKARDQLARGLRSPTVDEYVAGQRGDKAPGSDEFLIKLG